MSGDNCSSVSSNNSQRRAGKTFSEFATPSTPISSPSGFSSFRSSSPRSLEEFSEGKCAENSSVGSCSLGSSVSISESSFIETTVETILQATCKLTEDAKVSICDSFEELGIFEADAGLPNGSFEVYLEILTRIVYHVQGNLSRLGGGESRTESYAPIDNWVDVTVILAHLSSLCSKERSEQAKASRNPDKYGRALLFVNRFLTTLSAHMNKISFDREGDVGFPSLPLYRFIMGLMKRLVTDNGFREISSEIISTFCIFLHDISPKSIPIFAFQWLSIIGSGVFVGQVLDSNHGELEVLYSHHLLLLLDYVKPLLLCRELSKAKCVMEYLFGLTRLLFIIHHDFPDFFIRHGFQFIEFVPVSNVQLRCIILSTIPTYIRPTNPLCPGAFIPSCLDHLEMDMNILSYSAEFDYHEWCLRQCGVADVLAEYLERRKPMSFLLQLREHLDRNKLDPTLSRSWKEPEMRAVICYTAVAHIPSLDWSWDKLPTFENLGDSAFMDIYQILALALDETGRALFFSLVVDRLRYPCVETYYFFMILARLFTTLKNQIVKEQLVTALMQRILANPPHQWGVLAAFTELIQNPTYKFWNQPFLQRHPATKLLFDTVSRTWRRRCDS